jgi:glycosyltransferase involved in cell wall biosynthesis
MKLSVVVCTYHRYDALVVCLQALRSGIQTAPEQSYEVIVIDNTPKPARQTQRNFDGAKSKNGKWIACDEIGLSHARNAGLAAASGEIVAFIDDDAIAVPQWVEEIIAAFERHPDVLAVGGKVVPEYPHGFEPAWLTPKLTELLSCIDWGDKERPLREGEWIVGANMAFRRSVFANGSIFDAALGRKGSLGLLSNEDIAIIRRIGRDRILYDPAMLVRHVIPRDRLTHAWFRKRVFWQALSDQLAGIDVPASESAWQEIRQIIPRLPAERRNLLGLSENSNSAEEFSLQLRQLFLLTHLLASGMAAP